MLLLPPECKFSLEFAKADFYWPHDIGVSDSDKNILRRSPERKRWGGGERY